MKSVQVSVIILSHNTRDILHECLEAVEKASRGIDTEVIVVDNASGDGSPGMVRQCFPRARLVELHENQGFSRGNNIGIQQARGRLLFLINSDLILEPDTVARMVAFMEARPDAGAMGVRLVDRRGRLETSCDKFPTIGWIITRHLCLDRLIRIRPPRKARAVDFATGACLLLRRETLEDVGLFDERFFAYYEDADLCLRVRKAGWKIYHVPDIRATHYKGTTSSMMLTRSIIQSYSNMFLLFERDYGSVRALSLRVIVFFLLCWKLIVWSLLFATVPRWRKKAKAKVLAYFSSVLLTLGLRPRAHVTAAEDLEGEV